MGTVTQLRPSESRGLKDRKRTTLSELEKTLLVLPIVRRIERDTFALLFRSTGKLGDNFLEMRRDGIKRSPKNLRTSLRKLSRCASSILYSESAREDERLCYVASEVDLLVEQVRDLLKDPIFLKKAYTQFMEQQILGRIGASLELMAEYISSLNTTK